LHLHNVTALTKQIWPANRTTLIFILFYNAALR